MDIRLPTSPIHSPGWQPEVSPAPANAQQPPNDAPTTHAPTSQGRLLNQLPMPAHPAGLPHDGAPPPRPGHGGHPAIPPSLGDIWDGSFDRLAPIFPGRAPAPGGALARTFAPHSTLPPSITTSKLPAIVTATTPATVQAATASAPAAPTASREEIAALELLLAEPANQDMIRHFGGPMPSLGGNPVADSIVQRYGADLANRLQQLHNAQHAVRQEYLRALDRAIVNELDRSSESPKQPKPQTWITPGAPGWGRAMDDHSGTAPDKGSVVDVFEFTRQWTSGNSPAQRAFVHLYGSAPLGMISEHIGDGEFVQHLALAGQRLHVGGLAPDAPAGSWRRPRAHDSSVRFFSLAWQSSRLQDLPGAINPAKPDKLHNPAATWFDPVHGWMTPPNNIKGDWFERLVGVGAAAFATVVSGGIAAGLMPGMVVGQAAFTAGVSSIMQQGISGSGFSFRDVLRSALGGALNAGLMPALGHAGIAGQGASILDRLLQASGPAGIQNVLRDIVGAGFRSNATPALLHQVAREVHTRIDAFISQNPFLSASEHSALRMLSRTTENALRVLGTPGDPAAGFARDFLNSLNTKE
ncbi:hypothetical protein EII20_00920 [Comamonadaceae bacterium OH2545_COT-014]|nr:hypothetical protein EII20_00920 [Comamonadaceae bacterium OH2545_COT-014]